MYNSQINMRTSKGTVSRLPGPGTRGSSCLQGTSTQGGASRTAGTPSNGCVTCMLFSVVWCCKVLVRQVNHAVSLETCSVFSHSLSNGPARTTGLPKFTPIGKLAPIQLEQQLPLPLKAPIEASAPPVLGTQVQPTASENEVQPSETSMPISG